MAARQRLEREEYGSEPQVARPAGVDVRVQRRQRERNPLHGRQVKLRDAEETGGRKCKHNARDDGSGVAGADAACQQERSDAAEHNREKRDEIEREHGIAGHPENRRGKESAANQVLRVGERVGVGIEDVRVEDRERPRGESVRVPGERPDEELSIGIGADDRAPGAEGERVGEENRERDEQDRDRRGAASSGRALDRSVFHRRRL